IQFHGIDCDWVIHASNLPIEFFIFPLLAYFFLYSRLGLWYKCRRITGYYRDVSKDGVAGNAIVKISFCFPDRVEILGKEPNNVVWLGKDYEIIYGNIIGRFYWNIFKGEEGRIVPDYGMHDIQILPFKETVRMNVITTDLSGDTGIHRSIWERVNDKKTKKEVRNRLKAFITIKLNR